MEHHHPANGFGKSGGLSRVQPFVDWGQSREWESYVPNRVGRAMVHSIDREDRAQLFQTGEEAVRQISPNVHFPVSFRSQSNAFRHLVTSEHISSPANIPLLSGETRADSSEDLGVEANRILVT
jgi:hypothetical protein